MPSPAKAHTTRESWLLAATEELRPRFAPAGAAPADKLAVLVSWAFGGGHRKVLGECYGKTWTEDGTTYITVTPALGQDPARVLDVLLHELVHACGIMNHGKEFRRVATAVGLEGQMRATTASEPLRLELEKLAQRLGPYPHAVLYPKKKPRDASGHGYTVRLVSPADRSYTIWVSRKRLEGGDPLPICPISNKPFVPA